MYGTIMQWKRILVFANPILSRKLGTICCSKIRKVVELVINGEGLSASKYKVMKN